jgi:flavin-dependent dehydrogenase
MDRSMQAAMPTRFDAVVVGAGPAGSTVAIQLARAGWAVALIERQHFPRRKVCGECIAASNLPLLETLGIAEAFDALAGAELRQVRLLRGDNAVTADLPSADHDRYPWGRALGRESLDSLLLEQARAVGAEVFQPCAVQAILGSAGAWHCELRRPESATLLRLRATVVVDAHGSWEDLPSDRPQRRQGRSAADLFAFKANFSGSMLPVGQISVLALDGGYGGMVVADQATTTLACCIRRDRLSELRGGAPGLSASEAVQAWLQRECAGVRQALLGASRDGPWLSTGPLDPGVRLDAADGIFRVGNAAGEAHPILGEGMSMALQSAALLCSHLLGHRGATAVPDAAVQAELERAYAASWRHQFAPRLRLAAAFAHLAMRPRSAAALMQLLRVWPRLLTQGARWGGKVRTPGLADATVLAQARPAGVRRSPQGSPWTHPREDST